MSLGVSSFTPKATWRKTCPTQRALDGWDSAPFLGFIYAQAES